MLVQNLGPAWTVYINEHGNHGRDPSEHDKYLWGLCRGVARVCVIGRMKRNQKNTAARL